MKRPSQPSTSARNTQLPSMPDSTPNSTNQEFEVPTRRRISQSTPSSPFWEKTDSSAAVRSERAGADAAPA